MPRRTAAIAMAALVMLPSCRTRHEVAIDVSADGSGTVSLATGLDDAAWRLVAGAGGDPLAAARARSRVHHAGTREERWEEGGFRGIRTVTPFASLHELERLFQPAAGDRSLVRVRRRGSDVEFDLDTPRLAQVTLAPALDELKNDPSRSETTTAFEVRLRVRLPGTVRTHNADRVEPDGSLVWSLHPHPDERSRATTTLAGASSRRRLVTLGGLLAALGVAVGATVRRRRGRPLPQIGPPRWATGSRLHRMPSSFGGWEGPGGSRGTTASRWVGKG